jgi:hypothetical protein
MRHADCLAACSGVLAITFAGSASAHAVVGNRFFPATLVTDDPGVADELSLPTLSSARSGDGPTVRQLDVSGEYSKRLTSRLGISLGETWTRIKDPDAGTAHGFQNLETTLKYQLVADPTYETLLAAGLSYEWGASGSDAVGAERHSTVTPTLFFGQGGGKLPESLAWARPFAVTGLVGYAIPSRAHDAGEPVPRAVNWGLAVEYSLPYLAAHVKDLGLPEVVNRLTPVVEASFESPVGAAGGKTTGTVNPGLIWSGRHFQLAAEATLPINRDSGRGTGFVIQVHFFLDDLFPRSLGKPIW